jgi:hypothetical protein
MLDPLVEIVLEIDDVRYRKIYEERSNYIIRPVEDNRYTIIKSRRAYNVEIEPGPPLRAVCDCPDWRFNAKKKGIPCKHIWLVAHSMGLVDFPDQEDKDDEKPEDE